MPKEPSKSWSTSKPNKQGEKDEKHFSKAQAAFFTYLSEANTAHGEASKVLLKFHFSAEVESRFRALVEAHGCRMSTRTISRKEQNAIHSRRRRSCSQFTTVYVSPGAQQAYHKASAPVPQAEEGPLTEGAASTGAGTASTPEDAVVSAQNRAFEPHDGTKRPSRCPALVLTSAESEAASMVNVEHGTAFLLPQMEVFDNQPELLVITREVADTLADSLNRIADTLRSLRPAQYRDFNPHDSAEE
ncbi:hypothetical protein FB45DRAFT_859228 [Roridomyces roridus]|uniref:Uncharacterized protein n=1 Tax=Roridomyces roridus TaxID=1738132 RepID=A0AAD7CJD8_9AGAR|nr:hypothetical protein FB45DRAFT_859228 [Roridomyces roridus]